MAIASVNAASSTSSNWLKEAQESILAADNGGGMMGALNDAKNNTGSIKSYLANSMNAAANLALISQNTQTSAGALASQMAATGSRRSRPSTQRSPPSSIRRRPTSIPPAARSDDLFPGRLVARYRRQRADHGERHPDRHHTGLQVVDTSSIVSMANGAYLDTKNNILTMADGTKIDTVTGLKITV